MKSEIIKKNLSNGLRFIHIKNKDKHVIINVFVKVGSQDETPENNGISHFLEHMIWQGSKNYTAEKLRSDLKDMDANFNASTSFKRTNHFISGPRRHYEKMLKILLDSIQNPVFDKEEIERERKVILDEYKRTTDDSLAILQKSVFKTLFKDHSLSQLPIGTEENIKNITREDLIEYYNKHYVANNMIISISGDLEEPEKLIEKYFTLKSGEIITKEEKITTKLESKTFIKLKESISATRINISFLTPEYTHKDTTIIEIIDYLLDYGKDINLTTSIRQKLGLTYSIYASNLPLKEGGIFSITTTTNPEQVELLVESILAEFNKFETIKQKELNRAKQKLLQTHRKINLMPFFLQEKTAQQELYGYTDTEEKKPQIIKEATAKDLKRIVDEYFRNCLITIVEPREEVVKEEEVCKNLLKSN